MNEPQRRVVITGGPCSGKTSVIEALAERGFYTVGECAIEVISELTRQMGLEGQALWRARQPHRFQELILVRQRAREAAIPGSANLVFLDRGIQDGLAYMQHYGLEVDRETQEAYGPCSYHSVVLLDTLSGFVDRLDTGRTETHQEALAIRDRILTVYQACQLPICILPEMSIDERVAKILSSLTVPAERDKADC